jgi:hypothetical protein
MRALWIAVLLAGCGKNDTPETAAECQADYLRTIDKSCTVPADCRLVDHQDCCGTIKVSVRAGTEADAAVAEQTYEACVACPPTGCFHADESEDMMVPGAGQQIISACTANRCSSTVATLTP